MPKTFLGSLLFIILGPVTFVFVDELLDNETKE